MTKTASKNVKNKENYKDIKLKEKDYNNEKDLAFFIEQEKKAKKMLEEVENFRKSFYLSKFVDFDYILEILDYANWIEIKIRKYYNDLNIDIFIPEIDKNSDLTYFSKLNTEQKKIFKNKYNHEFGTHRHDLYAFGDIESIEYEEYRKIECNAEQNLSKAIDERSKLIKNIKSNFHPFNIDKKDIKEVEDKLNESFRPLIRDFILKYKQILKISNQNSRYLLTGRNIVIKVPSLTECSIEVDDDEKQVTISSNGDDSWESWCKFPSYLGTRHNITERLYVIFDTNNNEYISHEYVYRHEIEDIKRNI